MALFEIHNLTFSYPTAPEGKHSLAGIDLTLEAGEYLALCGKSGSGKTTLLRQLKSVLSPHGTRGGEILFDGRPLEQVDLREQSSRIGYVMQDPDSQIVTDKVWHELAFGLESLGCDQDVMRLRGGGDGQLFRHPGLVSPGCGPALRGTEAAAESGLGDGHAARRARFGRAHQPAQDPSPPPTF